MRSSNNIKYWGVIGLLIFTIIWFLPWRFDSNDDVIMMWLVSGAYTGEPEEYGVFTHPALSWSLSRLYHIFPEIQWYSIAWFSVLYISFLAIVIVVFNSNRTKFWNNSIVFFLLVLWIHFSLFVQFTIISGVAGFSGLLLFEQSIFIKSKLNKLLGLGLIILSILIRWESFVLLVLGFGLYKLIYNFLIFKKLFFWNYFVIAMVFCALFFSDLLYTINSEFAEFKNYTKARASVFDHPAFYTALLENNRDMPKEWFFFSQSMMDNNGIDILNLTNFKSTLDDNIYSYNQIGNSFIRISYVMIFQNFKIAFSIIILSCYIFVYHKCLHKMLLPVFWIVFLLIFNHFFVVNPRVYILFFLPLIFPIILSKSLPVIKPIFSLMFYLLIGGILVIHLNNFFVESKRRDAIATDFKLEISNVDTNRLIVFEGHQQNFLPTDYNMINMVPYLSLGWISNSPFQEKRFQKIGISRLTDIDNFYLFGLDANDIYYFPSYMRYLGKEYTLDFQKSTNNISFFHYKESLEN